MQILYTYRIAWSAHNKHYYGIRYANIYSPVQDLWKVYFTSSRHVKNFRKLHGEPDIIEIRKQFIVDDSENYYTLKKVIRKAKCWERTVLRRLRVRTSDKWLNVTDGCRKRKKVKTPDQILRKAKKQAKRDLRLSERRAKKQIASAPSRSVPKKKLTQPAVNVNIYSKNKREDRKRLLNALQQ